MKMLMLVAFVAILCVTPAFSFSRKIHPTSGESVTDDGVLADEKATEDEQLRQKDLMSTRRKTRKYCTDEDDLTTCVHARMTTTSMGFIEDHRARGADKPNILFFTQDTCDIMILDYGTTIPYPSEWCCQKCHNEGCEDMLALKDGTSACDAANDKVAGVSCYESEYAMSAEMWTPIADEAWMKPGYQCKGASPVQWNYTCGLGFSEEFYKISRDGMCNHYIDRCCQSAKSGHDDV